MLVYLASVFSPLCISLYYRRILFIYKYKKGNRIPSEHTVCLTFIKGDLFFVKKTFLSQINGSGWAQGWFEFMLDPIKRSAVVNATDLSLLALFHWCLTLAISWGEVWRGLGFVHMNRSGCCTNFSSLHHWRSSEVHMQGTLYSVIFLFINLAKAICFYDDGIILA